MTRLIGQQEKTGRIVDRRGGVCFAALDAAANAMSDLESCRHVNAERSKLFNTIHAARTRAA